MKSKPENILVIYSWSELWSMGPGKGSPDFYLSLKSLVDRFAQVVLVHPAGPDAPAGAPGEIE